MEQNKEFIKVRDNLKNYFSFRKYLGNSSVNGKLSGGLFNKVKNGDLTDLDIDLISKMIHTIESEHEKSYKAIQDFKKSIK